MASPPESKPAELPVATEIKRVDASGFTLGEYLPPLDAGKIEIAVPDGWKPLPRDSKYVVRFANVNSGGGLPRIEVIVEESSLGGIADLTEDNVIDFASAVGKHLQESGTAVIEPPLPMVIGSVPCARYVSHLKLKIGEGTLLVERQTLALLHGGRLYQINLLVEVDQLVESRDAAYAICAGIRFPDEQ
ncbi:MAG: hypothetical protein KDK74_06040 [Cephaloticoccus sp.]|nr:hypothetical protein [Cephaloticoccus sp.]